MEKTAQYYWDKVAMLDFQRRNTTLNQMLEVAEEVLSKDEINHLKELLEEKH